MAIPGNKKSDIPTVYHPNSGVMLGYVGTIDVTWVRPKSKNLLTPAKKGLLK